MGPRASQDLRSPSLIMAPAYNASVLPLPKDFDKKVNKTIFDFIWDNKSHKIKKTTH